MTERGVDISFTIWGRPRSVRKEIIYMIATKILMILGGVFSFCGGYFGWGFFVNNYKFKGFQKLFGEKGAHGYFT